MNPVHNTTDLTFIGSGIATSFTLIALLDKIKEQSISNSPLQITIIEKGKEFHTGLAYGPSSGSSALLITSLADFLPEGIERKEFLEWLSINKAQLIAELRDDGGDLSENWINTHKVEIEANKWEDIYLPRHFFGVYIKQKLDTLLEKSQNEGKIDVTLINDEVVSIDKTNQNSYNLKLKKNGSTLTSKKVVLSVGIPPIRELWTNQEEQELNRSACLISNPYHASITDNLKKIQAFAKHKDDESINVLIVGANASAMEMIYKLNDVDAIKSKIDSIYVVSPQGELPNSAQDESTRNIQFTPSHLIELNNSSNITALDIYNAANKDLDEAERLGYGTAISEVPVSKAFGALLTKLDSYELKEFACHYGNNIGKRQRRAGKHYTDVVDSLKAKGKLENVSGYFEKLIPSDPTNGLHFCYKESQKEETKTFNKPIQIVLNCIGGKTLSDSPTTALLDDLMSKDLCIPNPSKRGFVVNNDLEAQPELYVAGPLLAGNLINNTPLWHLEHCGRIIYLGKVLANSIHSSLQ